MPVKKEYPNSNETFGAIKFLVRKYVIPTIIQTKQILGAKKPDNLVWHESENPTINSPKLVFLSEIFGNEPSLDFKDHLVPLIFCDSNIRGSEDSLVFRDGNSTEILSHSDNLDFQTSDVLVELFGQILNLKKQNDTNQCGICAILNTLTILGMEHNWNVLSVRERVLQNQVQKGYSKLENSNYFAKDGFDNYADFPLDEDNFWLGQFDILDFFERILINSNFSIDKRFSREINIEDCEAVILNTSNHFIVCFQKNNNWYKIDSLQSSQNLLVKIDQNPLTIPHTSKIFFCKNLLIR